MLQSNYDATSRIVSRLSTSTSADNDGDSLLDRTMQNLDNGSLRTNYFSAGTAMDHDWSSASGSPVRASDGMLRRLNTSSGSHALHRSDRGATGASGWFIFVSGTFFFLLTIIYP